MLLLRKADNTVNRGLRPSYKVASLPGCVLGKVLLRRSFRKLSSNRLHANLRPDGITSRAVSLQEASLKPAIVPYVRIDNMSDPFATVMAVFFDTKPAKLLDSVTALKNLGLNIKSAKLSYKAEGGIVNTFFITDAETSEKILRSARLEEIRQTVLQSLLETNSESAAASSSSTPRSGFRQVVPTTISVREAPNGSCSILDIATRDRPGLLVDIVRVLKDINLNVVSAEIDTVGTEAQDSFWLTYHGEPLELPMAQLVRNALQYYLSLAEVAWEHSY